MTNDAEGEGQMRETLLTTKVWWDGRRKEGDWLERHGHRTGYVLVTSYVARGVILIRILYKF